MKSKATYILTLSLSALMLVSCINGTPGSSGSSSVAKKEPATKAPAATEATQTEESSTPNAVYPVTDHPKVNVYLETSGSMNGYVNGGTSIFQQVVKEFLSGINNAGFASSVDYNYINSRIIPKGNDLDQYITRLTPSSFSSGGNTATTDIGDIFKQIIGKTDNNTISIFISDCIISPGKGVDTKAYLRGQMTDIRDAVVGYINQYEDFACLVYQFDSGFKGTYYDFENSRHPNVNMQRPFYIWVFGHTVSLAMMTLQYVPDRDFRVAPFRNKWMIFNTPLSVMQPDDKYGVLLANNANNGNYVRVDGTTMRNFQRLSNQQYRFSFGANMSVAQLLMGDEYVEDTDNYNHMVNKTIKEKFYGEIEKDYAQKSPYTETFRVESDTPFQKGAFTLAFIPKVPKWAIACTDYDDRFFNGENDSKTYGLEYIFHGVFNGFNSGGRDNIIAEFNFEIK